MALPTPVSPDDLERLLAELDAGIYDGQLPVPKAIETATAQLRRFSELKPFDVKAWAERKGIKLPDS